MTPTPTETAITQAELDALKHPDSEPFLPDAPRQMIRFFVPGVPAPGGSKTGFAIPGTRRVRMVDACKRSGPWKALVAYVARQEYQGPPLEGPLEYEFAFTLPRPMSHYRTGAHEGEVKPNAPCWHTVKPDKTKLTRSTEDSLTGICWRDDSQVAKGTETKRYGLVPGVQITIWALPERG